VYVLVTSFEPLEVFLYKEGFGRFASEKWDLKDTSRFVHLTNTAVQAMSSKGVVKITFEQLKERIKRSNCKFDWGVLWNSVREIVLKCFICGGDMAHGSDTSRQESVTSFELFGFDILFDSHLRPYLLEVNASPSLACHLGIDVVKKNLVVDTLKLISPVYYDRFILNAIITRRMDEASHRYSRKDADPKDQLNDDIKAILHGRMPREFGQMPKSMGNYERIAPSSLCSRILKYKRS